MKKQITVDTLNGPETIEGMTVRALRKAIEGASDDAVVTFMFEVTPTVKSTMAKVEVMVMPAHAVFGNSEMLTFVGPEIENAKYERQQVAAPVDRSSVTTTNGKPLDQSPATDDASGQHSNYLVLSDEERSKGFVRPVRDAYIHEACGQVTTMGRKLAETYARDPGFYGATYCQHCKGHFPVGADGEFYWHPSDDLRGERGPKVGT